MDVLTISPTEELSDERWRQALSVNLSGPFFLSRNAMPHLLKTKGCIINVASTAGLVGVPYGAAYSASKSGLIGLTRAPWPPSTRGAVSASTRYAQGVWQRR